MGYLKRKTAPTDARPRAEDGPKNPISRGLQSIGDTIYDAVQSGSKAASEAFTGSTGGAADVNGRTCPAS